MNFCEWFDKQSLGVRVVLLIPFWGWIFSGIYRIFKYTESKQALTLLIGVLSFIGFGGILALVDLLLFGAQ